MALTPPNILGDMIKNDICDRALARIGDRVYVADSSQGRACDLVFDSCLRELASAGRWSFIIRRACLHGVVVMGEMRYNLPPDCIRLLTCKLSRWQLRGRAIVAASGDDKVFVDYLTGDLTEEDFENAPLFTDALVLLIAAKIAAPVSGNFQLAQMLMEGYKRARDHALTIDKVQDCSNDGDNGMIRRGRAW